MEFVKVAAPGRINIIGEHTDYNHGFVLPAAIDKQTTVEISRNGSEFLCEVHAINPNESIQFDLRDLKVSEKNWANYILGVIDAIQKIGADLKGFKASFCGNIPIGSGLSSSAALESSFAMALNELFELQLEPWQIIKAGQAAEHNFVGTECGIMDQFASVMGQKGSAMLLDCRSLKFQYLPLELADYELVLLNSNVHHNLSDSAYNERKQQCFKGVELLKQSYPSITSLRDVDLTMLKDVSSILPDTILRRCKHVVTENERVMSAAEALKIGNLEKLGQLIYASHESLQHDYEVSCPELDFLVNETKPMDFVLGSRMMGGGFGGCTLNLIHQAYTDDLIDQISTSYKATFNIQLSPYRVVIGNGAAVIA